MEEIEREAIAQTLERTGGNVKKTARILNYHRPTLYRKLKKFGLMNVADAPDDAPEDAPDDDSQEDS
jgi:DNA-binding NtrC family response regulator